MWQHVGRTRPDFAIPPGPGQESVWDYPRPPRIVPDDRHVVVRAADQVVADTRRSLRVLETASPPAFYLPPEAVRVDWLHPDEGPGSYCEWKGRAVYWSLLLPGGAELPRVAWSYPEPMNGYAPIAGWLAFYPSRLACTVDGRLVGAQAGDFYGGWITDEIVGPFKGEAGTGGW